MLMLLPLLAAAAPFDDEPRRCEIHRKGSVGAFEAYRQFPDGEVKNDVQHLWSARQRKVSFTMQWDIPEFGMPTELTAISMVFHDLPKGPKTARIELWRDGKIIPGTEGGWINIAGLGYRDLYYAIGWMRLRALAAGGPMMLTAVDEDGDRFAGQALDPALLDEPVALAEASRGEFLGMIADWRHRCPLYQEPEIIVT